ncbi:MAG: hypothetical protein IJK05_05775 [Bacteroidales bacterium]|nr:hypothetical protein [Bacteroidales bacterium]
MRKLLVSVICVLAIGIASASAQKKQIVKYVIDGVEVADFDGSQLEGLRIKSYSVETSANGKEAFHFIITENADKVRVSAKRITDPMHLTATADTIKVISFKGSGPVMILDGEKIISKEEFDKLNAHEIKGIDVIKNDADILKKYNAEGRGVVMIWTEKSKKTSYKPLQDNVKIFIRETETKDY